MKCLTDWIVPPFLLRHELYFFSSELQLEEQSEKPRLSFLHLADRPAHHFPLKGCSAYFLLTEHPLGARDELVRHTSSKPLTLKGMGGSIDSPRLSQFYARLKVDYLLLLYWTLKTELVRTTRFLLRRISSIPWYPHIDTCLQENTGLIGS